MSRQHRLFVMWLVLAALIVLVDQVTKISVERIFTYGERLPVIPGFFDITLHYNRGAAFSFLAGAGGWQRWFFTGLGTVAVIVITYLLRKHSGQTLFCTALMLIMGGAVGNVIDRVLYGHVIDFISVYYQRWYFPIFNVADSAITIGAGMLILDELLRIKRSK